MKTFHVVPTLKCVLAWRRASENFDCYPIMGRKKMFFKNFFLKVAPDVHCVPWFVFNEEKLKNYFDFSFVQVKIHVAHFGGPK